MDSHDDVAGHGTHVAGSVTGSVGSSFSGDTRVTAFAG